MKPSPVQLLRAQFTKVDVRVDALHLPAQIPNPLEAVFTFEHVDIVSEVKFGESDDPAARDYAVELRVLVDNVPRESTNESPAQEFAPYTLDVVVDGTVRVAEGAGPLARELAIVNGASLLWSAVREQVLNITSRMPAGPAILPTVHFHDLRQVVAPGEAPSSNEPTKTSGSKQGGTSLGAVDIQARG